jgi:DNA-binding transcriptional ArsR family regulator
MPFRKIAQKELADLLSVLAHPLRLGIVFALADGERDVSTLVSMTGAPQTAVSQALAKLRTSRLVRERKENRHVYYTLALPKLAPWLAEAYGLLVDETAQVASLRDALESARERAVPARPGARRRSASRVAR